MKILIATGIYPPEIGGPASFVRSFAREMVREGHEISVVTYGDEKTEQGDGWRVIPVLRNGGAVVRYLRYALAVRRAARSVDLVFLQGPVSEGFPGTFGAILAGKKTVMKVVGDYAWEMYQQNVSDAELLDAFVSHRHAGSTRLLEMIERWTARRASTVIVPSTYLKRIVEQWGVSAKKIETIHNSVPPLPETVSRDELRRKFGVEDKNVILTAVRAVPWKGVDFLLEVLRDLPPSHLLICASDGPMLETWKKQAEDAGLSDRVRFLGRIDRAELAAWYRAADVFALATGYEGFPHVIVEAVSVGLPCIVSDKGGNPETAELFPGYVTVCAYRDRQAWTDALKDIPARHAPAAISRFEDTATAYRNILVRI